MTENKAVNEAVIMVLELLPKHYRNRLGLAVDIYHCLEALYQQGWIEREERIEAVLAEAQGEGND